MKLYIPTSSLNIDNILSSESIAPYSCYSRRKFGYQTFVKLEANPFENGILLFSSIPGFSIEDPNRENYPMVIQIEDDEQFKDATPIQKVGDCSVFFWSEPIHISPANTQILFFSSKALVLSRQNCMDSKMCKLIDFYSFKLCEPSNYDIRELMASINKTIDSPKQPLIDESRHDQAKGFVYGYYIGASVSVSQQTAKLARIQKRIYDIVASLGNNPGQRNHLLEDELFRLDHEYESLDPMVSKAKTSWDQFVEQFDLPIEKLNAFLKELSLEGKAKTEFCKKKSIIIRNNIHHYTSQTLSLYNNDLQRHINSLIKEDREQSLNQTDIVKELDVNPDYSLSLLSGTDENSALFNSILVKIIWNNLIPSYDELRINRFSIATEITKVVKDILESKGKEWDNSDVQSYFHHLRQNIQDFTPFDFNEINDPVIKSLVAIILKGEDLEALIDYLESNDFADYRYALSIWGALQGYVRISRSVFSGFVKKDRLQKLLKDVNEILYHSELIGILERVEPEVSIKTNEPSPHETDLPSGISTDKQEITDVESWKSFIREKAKSAIKGKKNQNLLWASLESALEANGNNTDPFIFITLLNDFDGWKQAKNGPCAAWKQLQELLVPDYKERTKGAQKKGQKTEDPKQPSLWGKVVDFFGGKDKPDDKEISKPIHNTPPARSNIPTSRVARSNNILDDKGWIDDCADFIQDNRARRQFVIDMKWFVGNYSDHFYNEKKRSFEIGIYFGKETDNQHVIERLSYYMNNKLQNDSPNMRWLVEMYKHIPVNDIITYLKQRFNV